MKHIIIGSLSLAILTGCGSSSGPSKKEQRNAYLNANLGQYQGAYEQNGEAILARLSVHSLGATLVLTDDMEISEAFVAEVDFKNDTLKLRDDVQCENNNTFFTCTLANRNIKLERQSPDTHLDLSSLAGQYALAKDNRLTNMTVKPSGEFTAESSNCDINGQLSLSGDSVVISQTENSCEQTNRTGIAFHQTQYSAPQSLEVFIADSALSGDWIKQ